jgi:hypothetical protein
MATEFQAKVEHGRVVPLFPADAEALAALEGETVKAVLTQRKGRSSPQLRLWWAYMTLITDNLPEDFGDVSKDSVSDLVKIEAGHSLVFRDAKGRYREIPRSIAFAKLDQAAFNELIEKAHGAAARLFGKSLSSACLREAEAMLG